MAENYGKKFEQIVKDAFEKVDDVSIDRLHDQMSGFSGSKNIADFIVYKKPYEVYIECKTVHGNILPFRNITETQWNGLLEKSCILGVRAGIICWWVDKGVTNYIPIELLNILRLLGKKSIRYDDYGEAVYRSVIAIPGKKKRVFFDYDFSEFFDEVADI